MCNPVMNKPSVPATIIAPPFTLAELSMKVALCFISNVDDHRAMAPAISAEL